MLVSGKGEILADLRPTIWGHVEPAASARAETPLRYPGQYFDEETGLCYNRYRFYDPRIGRYVSPDPVGLLGGLDPFAYCYQQPFRFHDPLGLAPPVTTEVSGSAGTFRQDSGGQPGRIHPVVESAFPPRAPDNNGIYPGHRGGIPPGQSPTACGEPRALSRYIEAWEGQHRRDPTTGQVRPLDPSNPSDHGDIQRCLQSIDGISSTQPRSDGTVGARAPCPNCSQLLANLHQQYGQPNPSVIRPGATSRDGTDSTNFSTPSMDWVRAQQAAIAAGRGRSGPQPPITHTRATDGSLVPSAVPAPTGPAYPPHSGYGTVYP
ncbi:RHS repeat-associated core domain-containing protein [Sorangium sp. So ce1024]|uniref:RHS repeat-associated core domain-containing protein n=1 Tax=Sorangium sp. So ce1024 TaxID=3133327 RepID=UPI003EFC71F0